MAVSTFVCSVHVTEFCLNVLGEKQPLNFRVSCYTFIRIRVVASPREKKCYFGPSVETDIKIARQLIIFRVIAQVVQRTEETEAVPNTIFQQNWRQEALKENKALKWGWGRGGTKCWRIFEWENFELGPPTKPKYEGSKTSVRSKTKIMNVWN